MTQEYSDYLAHHGVKGQKWGIRRYQNEDGTLKNPKGKRSGSQKKAESETWKSSDAKYLSDEELNRRNSRLQRENQYRQLTEPKRIKALKWIQHTASTILVASAIGAMKGTMAGKYKNALTTFGSKAGSLIKRFGQINLSNLRG